jgi:hypothetical protein
MEREIDKKLEMECLAANYKNIRSVDKEALLYVYILILESYKDSLAVKEEPHERTPYRKLKSMK